MLMQRLRIGVTAVRFSRHETSICHNKAFLKVTTVPASTPEVGGEHCTTTFIIQYYLYVVVHITMHACVDNHNMCTLQIPKDLSMSILNGIKTWRYMKILIYICMLLFIKYF